MFYVLTQINYFFLVLFCRKLHNNYRQIYYSLSFRELGDVYEEEKSETSFWSPF